MKFENQIVMNCNEAIAWGAVSSEVDFLSPYTGSPVNFVDQNVKKLKDRFQLDIKINDSLNEHIAALSAAGASYCGARSLIVVFVPHLLLS